jgi:20S proteasome subunit beta 2
MRKGKKQYAHSYRAAVFSFVVIPFGIIFWSMLLCASVGGSLQGESLLGHECDITDLLIKSKDRCSLLPSFSDTKVDEPLLDVAGFVMTDGKLRNERHLDEHIRSHFLSTGTTIVGIAGPDFCVLAADSRATSGSIVSDKTCFKLHALASNCAAAGAGTAADLDHITRECSYVARLLQTTNGNSPIKITQLQQRPVPVHRLCRYLQNRLYEQGGYCQANLIVGGVYNGQAILRAIHPHGSVDAVEYTALGSGGLAAMAVLESHWNTQQNCTLQQATELAIRAVKAGIDHDLGSGSQVDLCVIGPDGTANYTRCVVGEQVLEPPVVQEKIDYLWSAGGVNGFGNIPCYVRSKRVLQESRERLEQETIEKWREILHSD